MTLSNFLSRWKIYPKQMFLGSIPSFLLGGAIAAFGYDALTDQYMFNEAPVEYGMAALIGGVVVSQGYAIFSPHQQHFLHGLYYNEMRRQAEISNNAIASQNEKNHTTSS